MAGCRGDGVQYSQLTNGSNISVGGWGCRTDRLTMKRFGPAHCHIPLCVRATDLYFGITGWTQRANLLTVITLPAAHLLRDSNTLKLGQGGNGWQTRSKCHVNQQNRQRDYENASANSGLAWCVVRRSPVLPPAYLTDRSTQAEPRRRSTPVLARVSHEVTRRD